MNTSCTPGKIHYQQDCLEIRSESTERVVIKNGRRRYNAEELLVLAEGWERQLRLREGKKRRETPLTLLIELLLEGPDYNFPFRFNVSVSSCQELVPSLQSFLVNINFVS